MRCALTAMRHGPCVKTKPCPCVFVYVCERACRAVRESSACLSPPPPPPPLRSVETTGGRSEGEERAAAAEACRVE